MSEVSFNFNKEQQEKFNLIYEETKKLHPHLLVDKVSKERIKVLIAYSVINTSKDFEKEIAKEKVEIDLNDTEIKN